MGKTVTLAPSHFAYESCCVAKPDGSRADGPGPRRVDPVLGDAALFEELFAALGDGDPGEAFITRLSALIHRLP